MKPLDPRLLREARAARAWVLLAAGLGLAHAALVVAQAALLAHAIAAVSAGGVPWLLAVTAGRGLVGWARERFGHRASVAVIARLRARVTAHAVALGDVPAAELTTLVTRGLDALDGYLTRYLPQLLTTATVTPAIAVALLATDRVAGWTVLLTLPLVPLFMALVGLRTRAEADARLATMQRLGAQVLDLLAGLPTLRALGRERGQAERVRAVGEAHRRATAATLRSAFLSALVLELLATLSVALVAVGVGLRLVHGDLGLETGLFLLILAPEAYLPLRLVGQQFHASADGLAACTRAFELLERPARAPSAAAPALRGAVIGLDHVTVVHEGADRATPAALSAELRPGRVTALAGGVGSGKSTAVEVLLGLRSPDAGRVTVDGRPVTPGGAGWWAQVAWVPQRPAIVPGTVAENVRLTAPHASDAAVRDAAARTGLADVVAALPGGWRTPLGNGGEGLSAGQRQRLALTRALLSDAPLVVLDEPTAHLDPAAEETVHETIRRLRDEGRTVLVVAHRPGLLALADEVVTLDAREPLAVAS